MKTTKFTPWFRKVSPVRTGVYERKIRGDSEKTYQYWDGKWWGFCSGSVENAMPATRHVRSAYQGGPPWRGLASKPAAP